MSPTILVEDGYQVVIFSNDHPPAHVHVRKAGNVARVRLEPVELIDSYGFKPREVRDIMELVADNQAVLLAAWDEIHPEGR